ncbi:MAG: gliding motility protein [Desulfobulbaceae bacterium DB1]|nr:MAG: gliding motility protein [Desulfobulbaceae bacterium DB1]
MYNVSEKQLEKIEAILKEDLIAIGVHCAILIDTAGNTIAELNDGQTSYDVTSFAALAAGNFAAVDAMAKLVGEQQFSLHFHRGEKESIHFSKVNEEILLICIFGQDVSLGFLRLKTTDVIDKIKLIWER